MARLIDRFSALSAFGRELGAAVAAGQVPASAGRLQEHALLLLEAARADALAAGTAPAQVEAACFAMVAWIDELIARAPGPDGSRSTLQAQIFNSDNAHSEFFHHLAGLTARDDEVREVYLDVLEKGFKGQYYFEDGDGGELGKLKRRHGLQLHAHAIAQSQSLTPLGESASPPAADAPPHAAPPRRPRRPRSRLTPLRVGGVIAVLMLLAIAGWWVG